MKTSLMKTSVRAAGIKSVANSRGGLGASELHGKRQDSVSQKRIISDPKSINWSKAGEGQGLDLVAAFKAHKKEMGAVERGNAEIGTHLLVVVPPEWIKEGGDIHDPNNPNTLKAIAAAKAWAESWQGSGSVFAYRFDLDEKGTGVIDLFTAPVFEQGRRNGKTVKTISPSMAKRELVKQTGEKTSGAAFQTSWAEWAETHLDTRMERGNRKEETGREHVHAEIYAKVAETVKAELETEFEVKKVEENDRLERLRAAREKQLQENYEAKQKQLDESYEARQAEIESLRAEHSNLEQKNTQLSLEIASKTNTIASLEKREAAVEANEAKKLALFNKSKVIQDKLEELHVLENDIKEDYEKKYDERVSKLNRQYESQKTFFEQTKKSWLDSHEEKKQLFEREKNAFQKMADEWGNSQNILKEINSLRFDIGLIKGKLNKAENDLAEKSSIIDSQKKEISALKYSKQVLIFVNNFLKKNLPSVLSELLEKWEKSPENPDNADEKSYSGPSGP